jgi:AcrR family transcriptional regulator
MISLTGSARDLADNPATMSGIFSTLIAGKPVTEEFEGDKRIERTRQALRNAFFELVLSQPYSRIKIADIIAKAEVGRSTFYEHYKNKDDLLHASLHWPMTVLASAILPAEKTLDIQGVLEHFWQNRSLARPMLTGSTRKHVSRCLSQILTEQLRNLPAHKQQMYVPVSAIAHALAALQLTLLTDWLTGAYSASPVKLAQQLMLSSRAIVTSI